MNNDLISREALKKKLQARYYNGEEDFDKGYNIGIETAIELVDNAPTVEPCLSLDNISDEDIKKFKLIWQRARNKGIRLINERPQGEWICITKSTFPQYQPDEYKCSECSGPSSIEYYFCPHCGADMRGNNK